MHITTTRRRITTHDDLTNNYNDGGGVQCQRSAVFVALSGTTFPPLRPKIPCCCVDFFRRPHTWSCVPLLDHLPKCYCSPPLYYLYYAMYVHLFDVLNVCPDAGRVRVPSLLLFNCCRFLVRLYDRLLKNLPCKDVSNFQPMTRKKRKLISISILYSFVCIR